MASPLPVGDQDVTAREHVRAVTRRRVLVLLGNAYSARATPRCDVRGLCILQEVDDIADGDDPPHAKRAHLERWRRDIDKLYTDDSPETAPLFCVLWRKQSPSTI